MGRTARVAAAVIAVSACGAAPRHVPPAVARPTSAPAQCERTGAVSVNDADFERCMGVALDRVLMAAMFRSYDDPALSAYVTSVGERLVAASGKPMAVAFRVIDDPDPEAFANLGGTIYVARGALVRMRDEAELAALLGHEIGHELAGHMREALVETFRSVERSREEREVDLRSARDDEIQADYLAVLLAARAGYDPRAVETMLRAIAAGDPAISADDPDDTHPQWSERLARVEAFAEHFAVGGDRREREYRAHVTGLVVGDDPRVAAVVGDVALFARSGIAIDLPHGAKAFAREGTVVFGWADGAAEIRVEARAVAEATPASELGPQEWNETVIRGDVAVVVAATGGGAERRAKQLAFAVRAPHDEAKQLHVRVVDLSAPRDLWPGAPIVEKPSAKI